MNFDFSDEQRRMQEEVRRMLADTCTSAELRRVLGGEAPYSAETWRNLHAMGAAVAAIPEEFGGSGMGYLELCLVAEEAGRQLAAVPFGSSIYLAAEALLHCASEVQQRTWLPRIAAGEVIGSAALAATERYLSEAAPVFDGATLSGVVQPVPDGMVAGLLVLEAGGMLLLVDLTHAGVQRTPLASLDPTRPLARIAFDAVPAEPLAGAPGAERVRSAAAVLFAFEQLGGAARALEIARDYALERKAFGRPIGGFQALKHKMADIYTRIELARVHVYYGAWALSSNAPQLPLAAAAARTAASSAFTFAAEESIEIHGGIGFTWEMDCHLYLRRARYLGQIIGSVHTWRARLGAALLEEVA